MVSVRASISLGRLYAKSHSGARAMLRAPTITENSVPAAARATITLLVASAHQGNVRLAAARATIAIFYEKLVEDMSRWYQENVLLVRARATIAGSDKCMSILFGRWFEDSLLKASTWPQDRPR